MLIDKSFQTKFILKAIIPLAVFVLIVSLGLFIGIHYLSKEFHFENTSELIIKISEGLGSDYTSEKLLNTVQNYALLSLAVIALLMIGYLFYIFLFFSHRIAGPIYRFEATLAEILNGNLTIEIQLRAKDEFKNTAEQFNQMTRGLRDRIRRIEKLNDYCIEQVREMLATAENPETKVRLEKTLDLLSGIKDSLSQFKT